MPSVDFCDVAYCASCDMIISVTDIGAVAGWTVGTEFELTADEDILAAKNLNLVSAEGTVSGVNAFAALALVTLHGGWRCLVSCLIRLNEESITRNSPS